MGHGRGISGIARFAASLFGFSIRIGELRLAVGEINHDSGWMTVHHRLLVRAVVHLQNPYLGVLAYDRVVFRINLGRILGRDYGGKTNAQHNTKNCEWSHW